VYALEGGLEVPRQAGARLDGMALLARGEGGVREGLTWADWSPATLVPCEVDWICFVRLQP
jgi:hypothetical protein